MLHQIGTPQMLPFLYDELPGLYPPMNTLYLIPHLHRNFTPKSPYLDYPSLDSCQRHSIWPQITITPNVPTIGQTALVCSVVTPLITPHPLPSSEICLPLPFLTISPSFTIPTPVLITIDVDTATSHNHTNPKYVIPKSCCWEDGCQVFNSLNQELLRTPPIPILIPRKSWKPDAV